MDEIWKDVLGYEIDYEVSNFGNVRYKHNQKQLSKMETHRGYYVVTLLYGNFIKRVKIHRLVASEFLPNINNKPEVNHIDFNKKNNNFNNLEWCTAEENISHAHKNGRFIKNSKSRKFTHTQIRKIRFDYTNGNLSVVELSNQYSCDKKTIRDIVNKIHYKDVI